MIPKDAAMLLSFMNLKLRDFYPDLDAFCEDTGEDRTDIEERVFLILAADNITATQFRGRQVIIL